MSVIIRLQNLPWSANSVDIRQFFKGLSIPDGGVHIVGGEQGDAFIAFSSDEDARQAMMKSGGRLQNAQVTLMLSSRSEMQRVIEAARQRSMGIHSLPPQPAAVATPPTPPTAPASTPARAEPADMTEVKTEKEEEKRGSPRSSSRRRTRSRSRSRSRDRERGGRRDRPRRYRSRSRSRDRERRRGRDRSRSRDRDRNRRERDRMDRTSRDGERRRPEDRRQSQEAEVEQKPGNQPQPQQQQQQQPPPPPPPPRVGLLGAKPAAPVVQQAELVATSTGWPDRPSSIPPQGRPSVDRTETSTGWSDRPLSGRPTVDTQPRPAPLPDTQNDGGAVQVRNLPPYTSYRDMRDLFRGIHVGTNAIKMINDATGRRTGVAYVYFTSMHDRLKGLERNGGIIRGSAVSITPLDPTVFASATDNFRPRPSFAETGSISESQDASAPPQTMFGRQDMQANKETGPASRAAAEAHKASPLQQSLGHLGPRLASEDLSSAQDNTVAEEMEMSEEDQYGVQTYSAPPTSREQTRSDRGPASDYESGYEPGSFDDHTWYGSDIRGGQPFPFSRNINSVGERRGGSSGQGYGSVDGRGRGQVGGDFDALAGRRDIQVGRGQGFLTGSRNVPLGAQGDQAGRGFGSLRGRFDSQMSRDLGSFGARQNTGMARNFSGNDLHSQDEPFRRDLNPEAEQRRDSFGRDFAEAGADQEGLPGLGTGFGRERSGGPPGRLDGPAGRTGLAPAGGRLEDRMGFGGSYGRSQPGDSMGRTNTFGHQATSFSGRRDFMGDEYGEGDTCQFGEHLNSGPLRSLGSRSVGAAGPEQHGRQMRRDAGPPYGQDPAQAGSLDQHPSEQHTPPDDVDMGGGRYGEPPRRFNSSALSESGNEPRDRFFGRREEPAERQLARGQPAGRPDRGGRMGRGEPMARGGTSRMRMPGSDDPNGTWNKLRDMETPDDYSSMGYDDPSDSGELTEFGNKRGFGGSRGVRGMPPRGGLLQRAGAPTSGGFDGGFASRGRGRGALPYGRGLLGPPSRDQPMGQKGLVGPGQVGRRPSPSSPYVKLEGVSYFVQEDDMYKTLEGHAFKEFFLEHVPNVPDKRTGVGYILFSSAEAAAKAIEKLNNIVLNHRSIRMKFCNKQQYEYSRSYLAHPPCFNTSLFEPGQNRADTEDFWEEPAGPEEYESEVTKPKQNESQEEREQKPKAHEEQPPPKPERTAPNEQPAPKPEKSAPNEQPPPRPEKTVPNELPTPKAEKAASNEQPPPKPEKTAPNEQAVPKPEKTAPNNQPVPKPEGAARNEQQPPKPEKTVPNDQPTPKPDQLAARRPEGELPPQIDTDCFHITGLPENVTDSKVVDFFSDVGLLPDKIHLLLNEFSNPTGEAYCEFPSSKEARRAITKNQQYMGTAKVTVKPVKRQAMLSSLGVGQGAEEAGQGNADDDVEMIDAFAESSVGDQEQQPEGQRGPEQDAAVEPSRPTEQVPALMGAYSGGLLEPVGFRGRPGLLPPVGRGRVQAGPGRPYPARGGTERGRGLRGFLPGHRSSFQEHMGAGRGQYTPAYGGGRGRAPSGGEVLSVDAFGKPGCVLSVSNVPYRATTDDILNFFGDFELAHEQVIRRFNDFGKPTGDARVAFNSQEDAVQALKTLDRQSIMNRTIFLEPV